MYKNNFIAAVKCNGKILREQGDVVKMPFGSEYSLLLKNKFSRKAVVSVEIDGVDVLDGQQLIVGANSETDLKGFMKGAIAKNKFKFIPKTEKISKHRGDRVDDGLVRVEFRYEKAQKEIVEREVVTRRRDCWDDGWWYYPRPYPYPRYPRPYQYPVYPRPYPDYWTNNMSHMSTNAVYSASASCSTLGGENSDTTSTANCLSIPTASFDEGITVKGSEVYQNFDYGHTDDLSENSDVITLHLVGFNPNGSEITKPLEVKTKVECETCGKKNKSSSKFCGECGTVLTI